MLPQHIAQAIEFGGEQAVSLDPGRPGVCYPFDVVVAKLAFEHGFRIPHAAKPQVPHVGLAGHIGDGHLVA